MNEETFGILFPEYGRYRGDEAKAYLADVMVELIESGSFFLTEIMSQPQRDTISQVIWGEGLDPDTKRPAIRYAIPQEIEDHRVTLESIDWDGEKFVPSDRPIIYKMANPPLKRVKLSRGSNDHKVDINGQRVGHTAGDQMVSLKKNKAAVNLKTAWTILAQMGWMAKEPDSIVSPPTEADNGRSKKFPDPQEKG